MTPIKNDGVALIEDVDVDVDVVDRGLEGQIKELVIVGLMIGGRGR